jgi:ATP-dependent Lon protease
VTTEALRSDPLDQKALELFPGKVVRKDLVGPLKGEFNVPTYVLEYLLGRYCSSPDPRVVEEGLTEVRRTLTENYVRPDAPELFKSQVRQRGTYRVIDKVRVRLYETEDKYWAELVNLGVNRVHIGEEWLRKYERLLAGGIWAAVDLEYDPMLTDTRGAIRPFVIRQVRPIQLAGVGLDEVREKRGSLSRDEWRDLLLRSVGLEPGALTERVKMLHLLRLVPFVERNFNLVELGPRNTGKSYVYRELSPYSILVSGGEATVASLFVNLATGRVGMVGMWDVVAFDEVAGLRRMKDATSIQILKDYMEAGSFSRGRDEVQANAGMVFVGNLNVDVDTAVRTSHLFTPFPKEMQDLALLDRIHAYLPGWELPKMHSQYLGKNYGFVVDYLAEIFRGLRELPVAHLLDLHFRPGASLNRRDEKAARRTVSGLVKLLHPDGEVAKDEIEEYLIFALEMRRRVKEQLKRMGGIEFWDTHFSYIDVDSGTEKAVGVPEQRAAGLIPVDLLPPGVVFSASADAASGKTGLFRLEVAAVKGGTGYAVTGSGSRTVRESARTAYDYLRTHWHELAVERPLDGHQLNIQVVDLQRAEGLAPSSMAFAVVVVSAMLDRPVAGGSVVLGDITLGGATLPVVGFADCLQAVAEQGARRALIPIQNAAELSSLPREILAKLDISFYSDPKDAVLKALGL